MDLFFNNLGIRIGCFINDDLFLLLADGGSIAVCVLNIDIKQFGFGVIEFYNTWSVFTTLHILRNLRIGLVFY